MNKNKVNEYIAKETEKINKREKISGRFGCLLILSILSIIVISGFLTYFSFFWSVDFVNTFVTDLQKK